MTKITKEIFVCDFCSLESLSLPECLLCGKHFCDKHGFECDMNATYARISKPSVSIIKEMVYVCQECHHKQSDLMRAMADYLNERAEEVEKPIPIEP